MDAQLSSRARLSPGASSCVDPALTFLFQGNVPLPAYEEAPGCHPGLPATVHLCPKRGSTHRPQAGGDGGRPHPSLLIRLNSADIPQGLAPRRAGCCGSRGCNCSSSSPRGDGLKADNFIVSVKGGDTGGHGWLRGLRERGVLYQRGETASWRRGCWAVSPVHHGFPKAVRCPAERLSTDKIKSCEWTDGRTDRQTEGRKAERQVGG